MAEFKLFTLPMPIVAAPGVSVSLTSILQSSFGRIPEGFEHYYATYWSAQELQNFNFDYWKPTQPQIGRWFVNGQDIGGSFANQRHLFPGEIPFANFQTGNTIGPVAFIMGSNSLTADDFAVYQEFSMITIDPAVLSQVAGAGVPRPSDIVDTARRFAAYYGEVINDNDCHYIAAAIAAATGAVFTAQPTQSLDPSQNEEYGFWRIVYRGDDPGTVTDWQTLVQPGDIVRMGWTGGGFHTTTVLRVFTDGTMEVYDNTKPSAGTTVIGVHTVDYDAITIPATITIYRLAADGLFLMPGTNIAEAMEGTIFNDHLLALGGNDRLTGFTGDDVLDGGAGTDTLIGGAGNDVYVNPLGDTIVETAIGGTDEVRSDATFSLASVANVENLVLTGTAAIDGTGNGLANRITGNGAANRIEGGGGADILAGGNGNDTYVEPTGDTVIEAANGGNDTVLVSATYTLPTNVERLTLLGTAAINGTGNGAANILVGNTGNNVLSGLSGNDTLSGGAGGDTLNGAAGADRLTGATQRDKLVPGTDSDADILAFNTVNDSTGVTRDIISGADFNGEDRIDLPNVPLGVAAAITTGALSTATFNADLVAAVSAAHLPAGRMVIFDPSAGNLNVAGTVYLIVDANGIAGYQANQDWVFQLENCTGSITPADFL